jgi:hypothetical protein
MTKSSVVKGLSSILCLVDKMCKVKAGFKQAAEKLDFVAKSNLKPFKRRPRKPCRWWFRADLTFNLGAYEIGARPNVYRAYHDQVCAKFTRPHAENVDFYQLRPADFMQPCRLTGQSFVIFSFCNAVELLIDIQQPSIETLKCGGGPCHRRSGDGTFPEGGV